MPTAKRISPERAGRNKCKPQNEPQRPVAPSSGPNETALAREMAAYGITRVPVDYFHLGAFRYINLDDALAQAKRTLRD